MWAAPPWPGTRGSPAFGPPCTELICLGCYFDNKGTRYLLKGEAKCRQWTVTFLSKTLDIVISHANIIKSSIWVVTLIWELRIFPELPVVVCSLVAAVAVITRSVGHQLCTGRHIMLLTTLSVVSS